MRKKWFLHNACGSDLANAIEAVTNFANKYGLKPNEIIIAGNEEDGFHKDSNVAVQVFFMYYRKKEIDA